MSDEHLPEAAAIPEATPVPTASAYATREELLVAQAEAIRAIDKRAWGLRRMAPATLRMVLMLFALLMVLQALAGGTLEDSVAVFVVVMAIAAALLYWSVPGTWRVLRATRVDAAAAQAWRELDRTPQARALPPGEPGGLATGWDRRDHDDLDEVATRRGVEAWSAIIGLGPRGHLLLVVPFTFGLVGALAVAFPGMDAGQRVGGAAAVVSCLVPASVLLGLVYRESFRRQVEYHARWTEREVLLARRAVLDGAVPPHEPLRPGRAARGIWVAFACGLVVTLVVRLATATRPVLLVLGSLLLVTVLGGAVAMRGWHQPRVRATEAGPAERLGRGRSRRVEVTRTQTGEVRLRPRDAGLAEVVLPAPAVRGVVPVRLPGALAPPGVVVVTDEGAGDRPDGLWLLSGRDAVAALAPGATARA